MGQVIQSLTTQTPQLNFKTQNLNHIANKNQLSPSRSTVREEGISSGAVTCKEIGKHSAGERIQMLHHPPRIFSYTTASKVGALDAQHIVILSNRKITLQTITTKRNPADSSLQSVDMPTPSPKQH